MRSKPNLRRGWIAALMLAVASASATALAFDNGIAHVAGPASIDGPLMVNGSLEVDGPATIHGPVTARRIVVSGPLETTMPQNEMPGQAGEIVPTELKIYGPLKVNGKLSVNGTLRVYGPLHCEAASETAQFEQIPQPTQDSVDQQGTE